MKLIRDILLVLLLIEIAYCEDCLSGLSAVEIHRIYSTDAEKEKMEIWEEDSTVGQILHTEEGTGKAYQEIVSMYCWSEKSYVFTMSSSNLAGWSEGSYFYVLVNGVEFLRGRLSGLPRKELILYLKYIVPQNSDWRYTETDPGNQGWTQYLPSWPSYNVGQFPTSSSVTRYYAKSVTLTSDKDFVELLIGVYTHDGFVLYVNGIEVNRYNLPKSSNHNTGALHDNAEASWKVITISGKEYLRGNTLYVAFEMHRGSTSYNDFKAIAMPIREAGSNHLVNVQIISDPAPSSSEALSYLVDGYSSTYVSVAVEATKTFDIIFTLNSDKKAWFNQYAVQSAPNRVAADPQEWRLSGSNDGTSWVMLDYRANVVFSERRQVLYFELAGNTKSYSMIKISIIKRLDEESTVIQVGGIQLLVSDVSYQEVSLKYPKEAYTYYVGIDEMIEIAPVFSGYSTFSVSPALPEGISIHPENGMIYGSIGTNATENAISYNITAVNSLTNQNTSTVVSIHISNCFDGTHSILEIVRHNVLGSQYDIWSVATGSQTYTNYGLNSISTITYRYCVPRRKVDFALSHTFSYAWKEGSKLDIYVEYKSGSKVHVGYVTLRDHIEMEFSVNTDVIVSTTTEKWQAYNSTIVDPPSNWYVTVPNTPEENWVSYDLVDNKGPVIPPNVWFIRRSIILDMIPTDTQAYELSAYCRGGIVMYVNGNEVYRKNVGEGVISLNSTLSGGRVAPYWHHITGAKENFHNGINSVAFAVINAQGLVNTEVDFDFYLYFSYSSNMMSRTFAITPEYSSFRTGYPISNIFDGDYSTRGMTQRTGVGNRQYWGFSFNEDSAEMINKYCIVSNDVAARYDLVSWEVYATNKNEESLDKWTMLAYISNVTWVERKQYACFYMLSATHAYHSYRFVLKDNANQFPDNMFSVSEIELFAIDSSTIVDNTLNYPYSTSVLYLGVPMTSLYPIFTGFTECSAAPALPSGIFLDRMSGIVSGTPAEIHAMATYTISCKTRKGSATSNTITLSIESCVAPKKFFYATATMGRVSANLGLTLKQGSTVTHSYGNLPSYTTFTMSICDEPKLYSLELSSTKTNGWGNTNVIIRLADGRELFHVSGGMLLTVSTPEFNPYYTIDGATSWKYHYGSVESDEWKMNRNVTEWESGSSGSFPVTESITQYYVTQFTLTDFNKYVGYEIQLRHQAGAIVYVNGIRDTSINMPISGATNATLATSQYASPHTYKASFTTNLFLLTNVIAIEIHRGKTIPSVNPLSVKLLLLTDKQPRSIEFTGSSSSTATGDYGYENIFDMNTSTFFDHNGICEDTSFLWTYDGAVSQGINMYSISPSNIPNCLVPTSWRFEGSRDTNTWVLLDTRSGEDWSTGIARNFAFYNDVSYPYYRLTVLKCNTESATSNCPSHGLRLSDITLGLSAIPLSDICNAADGFPAAISGTYSYSNCDSQYSGYRRRLCLNRSFQSVESFCTVSAPTSFRYPQDNYEFVHMSNITTIIPTIVCAECSFSVAPALPGNLTLSAVTGAISGLASEMIAYSDYTVTAYNVAGRSNYVLSVMVTNETVHCPVDVLNGWERTAANTTAVNACPNPLDYSGNITRFCRYASPPVWDTAINNCTVSTPNITLTNTTYAFVKNEQITPIVPTIVGSQITSRTISPTLPSGLYFDPTNAVISGKPTQKVTNQVYVITVKNANGEAQVSITITITALVCPAQEGWSETDSGDTAYLTCPTNKEGLWYRQCSDSNPPVWHMAVDQCMYIKPILAYPSSSYALQRNSPVSIIPTTQFYISSFTIAGTLPTGLVFNNANGAITGTGTVLTAMTTVTVTASNPHKSTTATLSISVNIYKCPVDGIWPETEVGQTQTLQCDNPTLKTGNMQRTCNGSGGSYSWGSVVDTCKYKAPVVTYPSSSVTVKKGQSIGNFSPILENRITSLSISPALPPGLSFYSSNGAISGTPTGVASKSTYTITAVNEDNTAQTVIEIIVSIASCSATGDWKETERGDEAYAFCPSGQSGVQSRVCGGAENETPAWKNVDTSGCVSGAAAQKPSEDRAFVRFVVGLSGLVAMDPYSHAAIRRVLAAGLSSQGVSLDNVLIEGFASGTVVLQDTGVNANIRVDIAMSKKSEIKSAIVTFAKSSLTANLRSSNVVALGTVTAGVQESSILITEYSAMNSLMVTLIVIIVVCAVIFIGVVVYIFFIRSKKNNKGKHDKVLNRNHVAQRGLKGKSSRYDEEEEKPRRKSVKVDVSEEEEEKPRKSKKSKKYEEEEEEEVKPRKSKKSKKYEEEEEEEEVKPRKNKKSKKYEEEEEEEEEVKPHKNKRSKV